MWGGFCNNIMWSVPRLAPMHFGRTVSKRAWPNAIQVWSWTACSQCILLESCISSFAGTVNVLVLYSSKKSDSCAHTQNLYIHINHISICTYIIYHISCSCFGIGCWGPLWTWNLRIISNQTLARPQQRLDIIGCWPSLHDDEVAGSCWHRGLITLVQQHGHVLQLTELSKRSKVRMLCNLEQHTLGVFPKWSILMQQPVLFWGQLIWPSHPVLS